MPGVMTLPRSRIIDAAEGATNTHRPLTHSSNRQAQEQAMPDLNPTSVYLYFDASGVLIYVGITSRGARRQHEHNNTQEWWKYVFTQDVEHYDTRERALERERELIKLFSPPFNTIHNSLDTRAEYIQLQEMATHAKPLDTPDKRISMRVGHYGADHLILVSEMQYAALAKTVTWSPLCVISAGGRRARTPEFRVIGGAAIIRLKLSDNSDFIGAQLMYRRMGPGKREAKRLDLERRKPA